MPRDVQKKFKYMKRDLQKRPTDLSRFAEDAEEEEQEEQEQSAEEEGGVDEGGGGGGRKAK